MIFTEADVSLSLGVGGGKKTNGMNAMIEHCSKH